MWHFIKEINIFRNGEISAFVEIPVGSAWFSGHFPNDPILPGIAQIDMVHNLVGQVLDDKASIKRLNRIRFKKIIRPGDQLEIKTSAIDTETGSFSFCIMVSADIVCNGNMTITIR